MYYCVLYFMLHYITSHILFFYFSVFVLFAQSTVTYPLVYYYSCSYCHMHSLPT